jgi:hypothetical protein
VHQWPMTNLRKERVAQKSREERFLREGREIFEQILDELTPAFVEWREKNRHINWR